MDRKAVKTRYIFKVIGKETKSIFTEQFVLIKIALSEGVAEVCSVITYKRELDK